MFKKQVIILVSALMATPVFATSNTPFFSMLMQHNFLSPASSDTALTFNLHGITHYPYLGLVINGTLLGAQSTTGNSSEMTVSLSSSDISKMILYGYGQTGENAFQFYGCKDDACVGKSAARQSIFQVDIQGSFFNGYTASPNTVEINF
ncbi:MAG: hypothetical protein A3E84_00070 [Gammaproteobacteria bacterium RIFCSPHIGHO2_12_FULL_42_13]|nr:MAG: hypothetical protein A3E84_00070 [Gammaproteobacteria bacterium RIFCSPHIGHO2_12_FULL_42_13]